MTLSLVDLETLLLILFGILHRFRSGFRFRLRNGFWSDHRNVAHVDRREVGVLGEKRDWKVCGKLFKSFKKSGDEGEQVESERKANEKLEKSWQKSKI